MILSAMTAIFSKVVVPLAAAVTGPTGTAAAIKSWADPFHMIMYLFVGLVVGVCFYQWKWTRDAKTNALLLVVQASGHGVYELVPLSGGKVTLTNPKTNTKKVWPINELTTVTVPYPGVAFIPEFLQKQIKMIGVTEEDWEPFTNRSPHRKNIVSPDVLERLREMRTILADPENTEATEAERAKLPPLDTLIAELEANASSYPTRELIASPSVLGNIMHERVTEVVTMLGSALMTKIEDVIKQLSRLGKPINAMLVYILIFLAIAMSAVGMFLTIKTTGEIQKVEKALGITNQAPPPATTPLVPNR